MRVTAKHRREAILICAIAASGEHPAGTIDRIVLEQELDPASGDLADEAEFSARPGDGSNGREHWAEAEAMLRTGWVP